MGSTASSPAAAIETYDAATGKTTYEGSVYTGYSSTPMMLEDYPYVIWGPDAIIGENYQLRLALEISLWGAAACAVEAAAHVGALALSVDPAFPDSDLNKKHVYTVDVLFYTAEGFCLILSAIMKLIMVGANIQFYATRLEQYGKTLPLGSVSQIIDIVMLFILPIPMLVYIYKIVGGVFIISTWIASGNEVYQIIFYNIVTFFELVDTQNDNYP